MPDNKKDKGVNDDIRIDPDDPNEMSYAAKTWGVEKEQILEAMNATDSRSRKTIWEYLIDKGYIPKVEDTDID